MTASLDELRPVAMPLAILALTALARPTLRPPKAIRHFILALVALTAVVGVGLNILLGLAGQVSLGHVGFYAIGAYTAAILTMKGVTSGSRSRWPASWRVRSDLLLALPALRVTGPYLAMVTIAFAFIVQHGTIEWRDLTGGANGLMDLVPPMLGGKVFAEREMAVFAILLAGVSLLFFHRLATAPGARQWWRCAMPKSPRARSGSTR